MGQADPLLRDIKVIVTDLASPEAKSRRLAEFARTQIAEALQINRAALGRDTPYEVAVDGKIGAALSGVRPDGVIVANFDLAVDTLEWIGEALVKGSPVLTGRYTRSHLLFVDGVEHTPGDAVPDFEEAVFVNVVPYARKIERGLSAQAPDGVYQAVAAVARQRFGNIAAVRFSYRSLTGPKSRADRQPAIVVRVR